MACQGTDEWMTTLELPFRGPLYIFFLLFFPLPSLCNSTVIL